MLLLTKYGESLLLTTHIATPPPPVFKSPPPSPPNVSSNGSVGTCILQRIARLIFTQIVPVRVIPTHLAGLVKSSKCLEDRLLVFGIPGYSPRRYAYLFELDLPSSVRFSCIMTIVNIAWLISCRAMLCSFSSFMQGLSSLASS